MNSFISWIGGKKLLRKKILEMMPMDGYNKYVEVFGGAGWVLFGREFPNKQVEIFNDMDGNLVNLWRCVKHHCDELQRELNWLLVSREMFFDAKAQLDMRGLTDIQRAARFFFLIRTSFGSDRRSFGTAPKPLYNSVEYLKDVNQRLERVVVEQKDFADLLKVYDSNETLFYLDPPYYGTENFYDTGFGSADHQRIKDALDGVKGRWLLSYNDCEYIRKLYNGYTITSVERNNNLSNTTNKPLYKELIITNY